MTQGVMGSTPHRASRRRNDAPRKEGPVVIVGGGLSGLAAGVELTSRGVPVVLFEQKSSPGGRAYSFTDTASGDIIDNGQHVLIAWYTHTMRFLTTIGTRELLSIQPRLSLLFHHPEKGFRRFRLLKLPSPLHLIWGILTFDLFSISDRSRILRAGLAIRHCTDRNEHAIADMTVEQWLDSVGQSTETKRSFWEPLAVSIMNEHIAAASALVFVRSLRKAFLGGRRNAALAIPSVGLSELYVDPAHHYINLHGGNVRCRADVVRVLCSDGLVSGVRLRDNTIVECSAAVLAVPSLRIVPILPAELQQTGYLSAMQKAPVSPIVSIHLWFKRDFMRQEFIGLIGKRIQWVFNKRQLNKEPGKGGHVSAVISAAYKYVTFTNEQLVHLAVEDLRSVYRSLVDEPTHAVVIREKRATFSSTPRVELLRPDQRTPVPNLFLAGDWTATGYPGTIEGAILSAERCAELVSEWSRQTKA